MQSVNISKLSTGSFKIVIDNLLTTYTNVINYTTNGVGIILFNNSGNSGNKELLDNLDNRLLKTYYAPSLWTVDGASGFTTIEEVVSALEGLGLDGVKLENSFGDVISPSGQIYIQSVEITRPADVIAYTGNDAINSSVATPGAFEFEQMAIANGGGGYIMDVKIESDMTTLAGTTVRVWLFNETPTGIIGDNVAFVNAYADKDKRIGYIDVEMDALLGSSTSVIGQVSVIKEYKCADTSLFALVQTITGFTPTSAGKLDIMFNVLKLS